jgi:predicted nucleic acid-binding protein
VYILDTDIISLYLHHRNQQPHLVRKIQSTRPDLMRITLITVDQLFAGVYRVINDKKQDYDARLEYCERFRKIMLGISAFHIVPMNDQSDELFRNLPAAIKRLGPEDCKIAAIAHRDECVVVTRNTRHFEPICAELGVPCEDWTRAAT